MTLNKTWKECLRTWKWIAEVVKRGSTNCGKNCVCVQKEKWLKENGYDSNEIENNCFFCHYSDDSSCGECPGRLVDTSFACLFGKTEHHAHPKAFYRKLVELNKIRLAKT